MGDLSPASVVQDSKDTKDQPATTANQSHLLLLKEKKNCDVTFKFPNLPDRIEAHENFLIARSTVFEETFAIRKCLNVQDGNVIEIKESTPERFQQFLEFIYSDKFETDASGALDLLHLAQKYKVPLLTKKCEQRLKTDIKPEDSVKIFESARLYGLQELMDRAAEKLVKSSLDLESVAALMNANEETMVYVIQRDDLAMEEDKLFQFILEWGRKQVGANANEQVFKDKLKNIVSKIRYTNMDPKEFTEKVIPTGLLSPEEIQSVISYIDGEEVTRKDLKIKFNIKPRDMKKIEKLADFFAGQDSQIQKLPALSWQRITFKVERAKLTEGWSQYNQKKPAIMAIKFQWPQIASSFNLSFRLSIREYFGPTNTMDFTVIYDQRLWNCVKGSPDEIPIESPIELKSGKVYGVYVGDESGLNDAAFYVDGIYYGNLFRGMNQEVSVDLEHTRLTFKEIEKNDKLYYEGSAATLPKISVFRGIVIGLV